MTGFSAQLVCLLDGRPVYISESLDGSVHDTAAYERTAVKEIAGNSGGGIGDRGYQGTGLVTPRKKPKGGKLGQKDKECKAEISGLPAPVERAISHFKSWRIFHSDYRRPYSTYRDAFDAGRGLFFFSLTWGLRRKITSILKNLRWSGCLAQRRVTTAGA